MEITGTKSSGSHFAISVPGNLKFEASGPSYCSFILYFGVQVSSEGSVPVNDGKSNSRYVSCSKPSLNHRKAPLGAGTA